MYALVVLGPGAVVIASFVLNLVGFWATVFVAAVFGGTVGAVILLLGKHSGAIINPPITFGMNAAKILHSKYFVPYLLSQLAGGLLAGVTLKAMFSYPGLSGLHLGSTALSPSISPVLGITFEALGTFILATSALIASTQLRNLLHQGLIVGLTLSFLILLIGPLTGVGFNPARSLGPSLAAGYLENLPIYIAGPIVGATAAGLVFMAIKENVRKSSSNLVCLC